MKIRDAHARINGNIIEYTMGSGGLEIIRPDGRVLFSIFLEPNFALRVDGGESVNVDGVLFGDRITITPRASNVVVIEKRRD